jgi:Phytanoyl-CoA dioxygenase (PhyH)
MIKEGSMTGVFYDPQRSDEAWRQMIYDGGIIILSPPSEMLALVEHTRGMIEDAFAPLDPQRAHERLTVEHCVEILSKLKPGYIHHPRTKELIREVLGSFGCSQEKTYQDVPRLRCAFPKRYLTTGIAYAHHPHRDTWYSAPMCQFNWWAPIYEFVAENGMAFHPRYWNRSVKNGSRDFNYYRWNAESRKNAAQHIGRDTRVQPHAEEPLELEPEIRFIVPPGGVIVFSGAQLHSTVPNTTDMVRWSIDFRTVNIDDVADKRGAPNSDSAATGTSLRDFLRVTDFAPIPENIIAAYDDGVPEGGIAVFTPGVTSASTD